MILGLGLILMGIILLLSGIKTEVTVSKRYIFGWHWFFASWYRYIFQKADNPDFCSTWERYWCRINGHPKGPIYHNVNGLEPDYRCKICGDEI